MSHYAANSDLSDFGTIADYLKSPTSQIDYVLHVKSEPMLATVAERLEHEFSGPDILTRQRIADGLRKLVEEGAVRVSYRQPLMGLGLKGVVPVSEIPRHTGCKVLYLPPFYLAHTPGFFEGTLIRPKIEPKPMLDLQRKKAPKFKV